MIKRIGMRLQARVFFRVLGSDHAQTITGFKLFRNLPIATQTILHDCGASNMTVASVAAFEVKGFMTSSYTNCLRQECLVGRGHVIP